MLAFCCGLQLNVQGVYVLHQVTTMDMLKKIFFLGGGPVLLNVVYQYEQNDLFMLCLVLHVRN